jgi:hypothetical protein
MRLRHVATTVAAVTAGLTAAAALRAERRASVRVPAPAPARISEAPAASTGGVVLPFVRPLAAAPVAPAPMTQAPSTPARCGDGGGLTKAGAPCGARATTGGRCHHHRIAA